MRILMPMGGKGVRLKRFNSYPKPLIPIEGKPMVKRVIESLDIEADYIYVVREEHVLSFKTSQLIHSFPFGDIVEMREDNDGQTETCLLAEDFINNDQPLFIVNCDNVFDWDSKAFLEEMEASPNIAGAALTFKENTKTSHWCFAEVDLLGDIIRLEEKNPISNNALAGGFYWKKGSDFVKYAKKSIEGNKRAKNGEFYLGSVYNEPIAEGGTVKAFNITGMQSLGTPEELKKFNV